MRNKMPIRTGNLTIIILVIVIVVFYFSGWFDQAKDAFKEYQTDKVSVDLRVRDSLLSVRATQTYELTEKLKMYEDIPVGVSRISKDESGIILMMSDCKKDSVTPEKDSSAYFQGYNDGLKLNKPTIFSDTSYWFISYNAKNKNNTRVYSNEVISINGGFIIKDIVAKLENENVDYIRAGTVIITFYDQTNKTNYTE